VGDRQHDQLVGDDDDRGESQEEDRDAPIERERRHHLFPDRAGAVELEFGLPVHERGKVFAQLRAVGDVDA
jgi:hypothetical protein